MGSEQHRLASRQDLRPAVRDLAESSVEFGKRSGSAAIGWNSEQAACRVERRDDRAVFAPTATQQPERGIAQNNDGAACYRNLLQLTSREERDPLVVRREEGCTGAFRSGKLDGLVLIEPPREEPVVGYVDQPCTVGRDDHLRIRGQ